MIYKNKTYKLLKFHDSNINHPFGRTELKIPSVSTSIYPVGDVRAN